MDPGGDERLGFYVAGGLLIGVGFGVLAFVNLLLHWEAGASGFVIGPVWVGPTMGAFAWAALGAGLFTGAMGIALLALARMSPKGAFVLPGYAY